MKKLLLTGKFVSVKGTVVRVSNIKPLCTKLAFECVTCGTVQVHLKLFIIYLCIYHQLGGRR